MTPSLADAARDAPDRAALAVGDERISFADLESMASRPRAWLARRGLGSGARLALVGSSDRATIVLMLAAFEAGVVPVVMHPRWTAAERAAAVAAVAPDAVAPEGAPWATVAAAPSSASGPAPDPEAPLVVLFTSGTTGAPRGVVLSRRAFTESARASGQNLGWQADDRWLLALPVAHVGGLSILTRCLMARATVVLPPELERTGRLTLEAIVASVERDRVTLLSVVPTQLARLLDAQWTPPPTLRAILVGGAACSPSLLARSADRGWPVLTTYGLTEACSQVTTQLRGTTNRGDLGAGRPLSGTEVTIRDGRIRVRGATLLSGYVPATDAPLIDANGWFDTGDHGEIDASGNLHVLGRGRDLIITGGENVHPAEVERCLVECPGVVDACAFGVPSEEWGQTVAAALVVRDDYREATLAEHVQVALAGYKRPRAIALLEDLPTTPAGKLDRDETARRATSRLVSLTSR